MNLVQIQKHQIGYRTNAESLAVMSRGRAHFLTFETEFMMLVLTRKLGEVVTIGDGIEVTVIEVRGDKVRLGIAAPRNIPVHRKEASDFVKAEMDSRVQK